MKNLNVKALFLATIITYTLGITAFLGSFFVPLMKDPEAQANLFLALAIMPSAMLGAHFYYRKARRINGLFLGSLMFLITIVLDASITVPLFVIPAGGNHTTFFSDPGFWLIGLLYVLAVVVYWRFCKKIPFKISA